MPSATELAILIKARDDASHVFDQVNRSAGGLGSALGTMGKVAGGLALAGVAAAGAAVVGLGAALRSATADAMEAQLAEAQLDAVLKSTGAAARTAAQEYAKASQTWVNTTKASSDELNKWKTGLNDAQLKSRTLSARMQEQRERIRQLTASYGANALNVQTAKARLAEMENEASKLNGTIAELTDNLEEGGRVTRMTLAQQLGLTAPAARMTKAAILELADALSAVTRYEDEAILAGENLLLTFTNIGADIFPQATEVMLDMSTAMGQDLKSSAIQLGKALQDPILGATALRRVGVNLNDQQMELIKTLVESGDLLGAQKLILKELQTEFGGAARAAGETLAGKMDILHTAIGNVKEALGKPLLDPLTKVFGVFIDFARDPQILAAMSSLGRTFGELATGALPVIRDLFTLYITPGIRDAVRTLKDFIDILTGEYRPSLALGVDLGWAMRGEEPVKGLAERISDAIREGDWTPVFDALIEVGKQGAVHLATGLVEAIPKAVTDMGTAVKAAAEDPDNQKAWRSVGRFLADLVLGEAGKSPAAQSDLDAAWQWIVNTATAINNYKEDIKKLGGQILIDIATGFGERTWERLKPALDNIWKAIDRWWKGIQWDQIGKGIAEAIVSGFETVKKGFIDGLNWIIDKFNEVINSINSVTQSLPEFARPGKIGQIAKIGMKQGGAFVVPPGFPGDTFPVLVSSGELVQVWPRGKVPRFQGGTPWPPGLPPILAPKPSPGYTPPSGAYSPGGIMAGLGGLAGYNMGWEAGTQLAQGLMDGVTYESKQLGPRWAWLAKWPIEFMRAAIPEYRQVGIAWVDSILKGISTQTLGIGGDVQELLKATFKRWYTALKDTWGAQPGLRNDFQEWMEKWFTIATTVAGESFEQIAERMLNTAISYGGAIGRMVTANKELFMTLLGPGGQQLVGGMFGALDKIMELASVFSSVGGAAATRMETHLIEPAKEHLALLEEQLKMLQEQGGVLEGQGGLLRTQEDLARAIAEQKRKIADYEQMITNLQKQQADLQFLQSQVELVKLIKEQGLDAKDILGGLKLGLGADLPGLITAMTKALQAMLKAAEKEMGISSPSRRMMEFGRQMREGLLAGFGQPVLAMAPATAGNTYNYNLSANYRYQSERSLMDDVRMLEMLHS